MTSRYAMIALWLVYLALSACDRSPAKSSNDASAESASGPVAGPSSTQSGSASQPKAQVSETTAGDCATILQNIQAGMNVNVNVTCDVPTEKKLVQAVVNGSWITQCPLIFPAIGWTVIQDSANGENRIIPSAGTYFAQYDFRFEVAPSGGSQVSFVYVHQLDWDSVHDQLPGWTQQEFQRQEKIRELVPADLGIIPAEASALLYSDENANFEQTLSTMKKQKVGDLSMRRKVIYEDGVDLKSESFAVYEKDGAYLASIGILPLVAPYPDWRQKTDEGTEFELSCSASNKINVETFKTLCTAFSERHALSPDVLSGSACEKQENGESDQKQ